MSREPFDQMPNAYQGIARRRPHRATVTLLVATQGLALLMGLSATLVIPAAGHAPAGVTAFGGTPGDWVTFKCVNGAIALNGSSVCHDSTGTQVDIAGGNSYQWYTMTATPDSGYLFISWTTVSDAYLGSYPNHGSTGTTSSVELWAQCPPLSRCGGSVTLTTRVPILQTLTARVFGGAGTLTIGGTNLSNGQSTQIMGGSLVTVAASVTGTNLSFWKWLSDDGTMGAPFARTSNFTVGDAASGIGNVTAVANNSTAPSTWAGVVESGSGVTAASATFTIPNGLSPWCLGRNCISSTTAFWVGIGGVWGTQALWQAGVAETYDPISKTVSAQVWYEAFCPGSCTGQTVGPITGPFVSLGSTVTVSVSYNPSTGVDSYSVSCVPSSGCGGNLPFSGTYSAGFTPDTTTADWIAEYPTHFGSITFASPSVTAAGGTSSSFVGPIEAVEMNQTVSGLNYLAPVTSVTTSSFTVTSG